MIKLCLHQVALCLTHGPSRRPCRTGSNLMSLLGPLQAYRLLPPSSPERLPFATPRCPRISPFHDRFRFESGTNLYFHRAPLATGLASLSHRNNIHPARLAIFQHFRRVGYAIILRARSQHASPWHHEQAHLINNLQSNYQVLEFI